MGIPMIYYVETTEGTQRLFNAVISTGAEVAAQHVTLVPRAEAAQLEAQLRWLADGPKVKWEKVVAAARRAVRKFLRTHTVRDLYLGAVNSRDHDYDLAHPPNHDNGQADEV